jgi:methionyl aminopeptidase
LPFRRRVAQAGLSVIELRSQREMKLMRRAGLVVHEALQAAGKAAQPGATTEELDAVVERIYQAHGVQPLFKGVPGKIPFPAATCVSVNEQVVHGIPGRRKLRPGDIVSIDTGCRLNGWCGDSAWTFAVGQVSSDVQRLMNVTLQSLNLAIDLVGRKRMWSEVASEISEFVRSHGFSVVESMCGHGVGRELHEPPQYPNHWNARSNEQDVVLRTGLVIAIEPMVNMGKKETRVLSDHWTVATSDGRPSAHYEHTVALASDGPWLLTAPPQPGEEP